MTRVADDDIRWLLSFAEAENLAEIEVCNGDAEILVRMPVAATAAPAAFDAAPATPETLPDNVLPVLAPMAGVFYRSPSPESSPFVEIGDEVRAGDPVGLIEAMKLFNEVPVPVGGKIVKFLVENEQQVDSEQPLMLIEVAP